jgi:hypothetical protein
MHLLGPEIPQRFAVLLKCALEDLKFLKDSNIVKMHVLRSEIPLRSAILSKYLL